jgi:hypothetical protein
MRRLLPRFVLVAVMAAAFTTGAEAYLKLGVRVANRTVSLRWNEPIRYFVTNRDAPGVAAPTLRTATDTAFSNWASVEGVELSSQFAGFTGAEPFDDDGLSVIGFQERSDLERTLGATTFTLDTTSGEIVEADIFLNTAFNWSTAAAGTTGRFDVESIMTHEVGHLLGLGHSALGETELLSTGRRRVLAKRAVMFPIAYPEGNIEDRTLEADDRAGLADIYAGSARRRTLGSIGGRVTLNGSGIFGAHVTAFNPSTGETVAGFSLNDNGDFAITGLEPGLYVVRVEPLDDADVDSFFDDDTTVNINFRPTYSPRLVSVPPGGSSGAIEIRVTAR